MTSSNMLYAMYLAAPELFDRRLEKEPRWHQEEQRPSAYGHGRAPRAASRPGLLRPMARRDGIGATLVSALHRLGKPFSR